MKLEFSRNIFKKIYTNKFHENSSSGNPVFFPCGQTDRRYEDNSRFPKYCERSYKTDRILSISVLADNFSIGITMSINEKKGVFLNLLRVNTGIAVCWSLRCAEVLLFRKMSCADRQ